MSWRVGGSEVIHGIDKPSTEEVSPHAVNRSFGKEGMGCHPLSQLHSRVASLVLRQNLAVQECGLHWLFGSRMKHRPGRACFASFCESSAWHICEDRTNRGEAPKKGGHPPILVLSPSFIGMVMALSTVQPSPHENPHLLGHIVVWLKL